MKNVVIIGAGLSGLACAIEFLQYAKVHPSESFTIHLLEKRDFQFSRRQKLVNIKKQEFSFFKPHSVRYWDEYCQQQFSSQKDDADKRKKLLKQLSSQPDYYLHPYIEAYVFKNFTIKALQTALFEHLLDLQDLTPNAILMLYTKSQPVQIYPEEAKLVVVHAEGQQTIKDVSAIFNCEGGKHQVTELLNTTLKNDAQFLYQTLSFPDTCHGAARFKVDREQVLSISKVKEEHLKKFQALGWKSNKLPSVYIIDDNNLKNKPNIKLFLATMLPKEYDLLDVKTRTEKIIAFLRQIASMAYKAPAEAFTVDDIDANDSSKPVYFFKSRQEHADHTVCELQNGMKMYLVGDAALSNFYPAGYSSVIALNEACYAVKTFCQGAPLTEYQLLCDYYQKYLRDELDYLKVQYKDELSLSALDVPAAANLHQTFR